MRIFRRRGSRDLLVDDMDVANVDREYGEYDTREPYA